MDTKSMSLSKKLDGGYLHVKKRASNVKLRSKGGSNSSNRSNKGGGYSNYLKRLQGSQVKGGSQVKSGSQVKGGNGVPSKQKVVSIQLAGSKRVYKSPKKSKDKDKDKDKDINDISKSTILPKKAEHKKAEPKKEEPKKAEPKKKGIPIVLPVTKGSLKKRRVSRSRCRSNSLTKRRCQDLKKGKRISISKVRHLSKKDVTNIQSKLKSIKGKSTEEIKKELDKQGIQVSGKSPSILKDIYMYSQLCGINIKRE